VSGSNAELAEASFRAAVRELVPYEPGKPIEEIQRELGVERVVKLASNEGPYGPFPAALEALERASRELNRYPDGGAYRLRTALAERHGVQLDEIAPGAGADGIVDCLSQALLDPGDEIVCGWPSFPSYSISARKMAATPRLVPLDDALRYDLEAILDAVGPRTKIVYLCHPNNPTGTTNGRAQLDTYFERVPDHVLTVVDQAYFEYVDDRDYPDAVEEYFKGGRKVAVLRTFSKIFGLAGVRVGYAVASASVVTAIGKVRRAFDVTSLGQEAALASLPDRAEIERRRLLNASARTELEGILRRHGHAPASGAVGNFVYVEAGEKAVDLFERLLREGVIVRPLAGFGAPTALRITAGTPDEHALLDTALSAVSGRAQAS
jgi:histidinol-phosphate aminotransferase